MTPPPEGSSPSPYTRDGVMVAGAIVGGVLTLDLGPRVEALVHLRGRGAIVAARQIEFLSTEVPLVVTFACDMARPPLRLAAARLRHFSTVLAHLGQWQRDRTTLAGGSLADGTLMLTDGTTQLTLPRGCAGPDLAAGIDEEWPDYLL